jgi:rubrerythrin
MPRAEHRMTRGMRLAEWPAQQQEDPMAPKSLEKPVHDLLCQALETEIGGVDVYRLAVLCAENDDLKEEWQKYLEQTERHVEIVRGMFASLDLDPEATTPGRAIVRDKGQALVSAMRKALKDAPDMAQVVAAECVVDAETKDHQNWELIGELSKSLTGEVARVFTEAYDEVEDEEDEHLYHTRGWCRELWLDSLGLPAVMPPPEEERDVKTAKEAADVEQERKAPKKVPGPSGKRVPGRSRGDERRRPATNL